VRRNPYETVRYLSEYLLFHYGQPKDLSLFSLVPQQWLRFHRRLLDEFLLPVWRRSSSPVGETRALDLGCGVGRFTFELARLVERAVGIDNSKAFVRAAKKMGKKRQITLKVKESGTRTAERTLRLPSTMRTVKVGFEIGDAMKMVACRNAPFQIVTAVNLICRLSSPRKFLNQVHWLVAPGGYLLLASPFSWLREYTPQREWLTEHDVQELLSPHFRQVRSGDLPFLIREHQRKYQLVISKVMVFKRRS